MPAYIPAIVIQKNNSVYIADSGITVQKSLGTEFLVGLGLATEVPTADGGGVPDADYWASPVGEGILSGIIYHPYNANDPVGSVPPSPQSFRVVRIMNRLASDYWYIVGSMAQYIAANGGTALPTNITTLLAPCQKMCQFDANSHYFAIFGLPTITVLPNKAYFPYGYFNGVALPGAASGGYTTTAALLTFLNTATTTTTVNGVVTAYAGGWAVVGTWTASADNLTLFATQTAGAGTDTICAVVAAINPSL